MMSFQHMITSASQRYDDKDIFFLLILFRKVNLLGLVILDTIKVTSLIDIVYNIDDTVTFYFNTSCG
jgi:hypothetical protein